MFSPLSIQIENYMVMRFKLMNHKEIKLTLQAMQYYELILTNVSLEYVYQ